MALPPVVAFHEIVAMLGVSRARVSQLIDTEHFPDHYVRLRVGRIWSTEDIVQWAQNAGRSVNFTIDSSVAQRPSRTAGKPPRTASNYDTFLGGPLTSSTGRSVKILPEEKNTEVAKEPGSPSLATLATSTLPPKPPETPQRTAQALNREALAEDWDDLERIFKTAKQGETVSESDLRLVGLATMVIANGGNVPNYRKTKPKVIKAWAQVREDFSATPIELVALAQHLIANADFPWYPGAIKKFSDYQIAAMRRESAKAANGRKQSNRWQGARGGQIDESIAKMTEDQKRRFGVKGYTK